MKLTNEAKIGILVTIAVSALLFLTFKVGNFKFTQQGYTVKTSFYRIDGLEKNAPVRLNGMEVGSVKDIRLVYDQDTKMELTLWIKEEAKIREGAKAFIKIMGMLGEKYVELSAGNPGGNFLAQDALIEAQEPIDFDRLLAKGDAIADSLKEISENINQRLKVNSQAIDDIVANMNTSMKNISSISGNVDERLKVNRLAIDEIVANLNATSKNLEELSADVKVNPWKLLYKGKEKPIK
ncbi:MAG TPA: MlaD family protein [Candidatus Omnitrophota bacterium]|nr:MlaD family protein [Candidatus Omnitrophota bacterium]HPD85543.1 MlaD family protein [Candidatus Omnitrophota bacterium]HRZ04417.1 MlaD family protein [Candidatus Omnitrophota bacterium]